jgi:hypothetical protein
MSEQIEERRSPHVRVVWGIEGPGGIAETINRSPSETRWLIQQKRLRVKRHGPRTYSALEHELIEDCAGEYQTENSES